MQAEMTHLIPLWVCQGLAAVVNYKIKPWMHKLCILEIAVFIDTGCNMFMPELDYTRMIRQLYVWSL